MALAFVLEITPQVLFSLLGGALADKISKKRPETLFQDCSF